MPNANTRGQGPRQPQPRLAVVALGVAILATSACSVSTSGGTPPPASSSIYIGSEDGHLYAIDATTGCERWAFQTGGADNSFTIVPDTTCRLTSTIGVGSSAIQSAPAVANGVVYLSSDDHYVYALDAKTGNKKWTFFRKDEMNAPPNLSDGEAESSPAVGNGVVYVGSRAPDHELYALDASTGSPIWPQPYPAGGAVLSSPRVVDGVVYFGSDDGFVYALDAATSLRIWQFQTGGHVRSSPAVVNGVVYVGSDDGSLYAIDASTGKLKWRYLTGAAVESSPAVKDGRVFVGSLDHYVYALNAVSGEPDWKYKTGDQVESSPAIGFGRVFIGSDDWNLYALDEANGTPVWNYSTRREVESSPVLINGVVYFGSDDGNVYALNTLGMVEWTYHTAIDVRSSPSGG
jgi:eukaryotic-like serine/threonine-protein kinase